MKLSIAVENIRCGGCANTITKKLTALEGVSEVDIQIEEQIVNVDVDEENRRDSVVDSLKSMGYPEQGTAEGLDAVKDKAKSFVSCAVGKVS